MSQLVFASVNNDTRILSRLVANSKLAKERRWKCFSIDWTELCYQLIFKIEGKFDYNVFPIENKNRDIVTYIIDKFITDEYSELSETITEYFLNDLKIDSAQPLHLITFDKASDFFITVIRPPKQDEEEEVKENKESTNQSLKDLNLKSVLSFYESNVYTYQYLYNNKSIVNNYIISTSTDFIEVPNDDQNTKLVPNKSMFKKMVILDPIYIMKILKQYL